MRGPALFAGLTGTYMETLHCSARAETEETIVEALLDNLGNLYLFSVGMLGIEEVVPGVGSNGGRNACQRRFKRCKPCIAHSPG